MERGEERDNREERRNGRGGERETDRQYNIV